MKVYSWSKFQDYGTYQSQDLEWGICPLPLSLHHPYRHRTECHRIKCYGQNVTGKECHRTKWHTDKRPHGQNATRTKCHRKKFTGQNATWTKCFWRLLFTLLFWLRMGWCDPAARHAHPCETTIRSWCFHLVLFSEIRGLLRLLGWGRGLVRVFYPVKYPASRYTVFYKNHFY